MKKFTVILLYPDYATETYGQDTYCTIVDAQTPAFAVRSARIECNTHLGEDAVEDLSDLYVIAVFEGGHVDINPESLDVKARD